MQLQRRAMCIFSACALVVGADLTALVVRHDPPVVVVDGDAVADGAAAVARRIEHGEDPPSAPTAPSGDLAVREVPGSTATPTTTVPTTTTTTLPARAAAWTLEPYRGTGVWVDVYDWTAALTGGRPGVSVESIDQMAGHGIQTLYIQTAHRRFDVDVVEPERLAALITRAHERGIAVVAWYLPSLVDVGLDLRRLTAAANLPIEGVGVDIESLEVTDPVERSRRLVELSAGLRGAVGTKAVSAIVQSPVVMQVVNPNYWPGFPWAEIGQLYDVVQPMSYWSERKPEWRSGQRVSTEDIDRIRASTARPDIPVHVIGGIAHLVSLEDVAGMVSAVQGRGAIGASLYDWNTSNAAQWDLLRPLRSD